MSRLKLKSLRQCCIVALFLLVLPAVVQAQFTFTNNNGAITITGYTGPGGTVAIPDTINSYPVTEIGAGAFASNTNLTGITITGNVMSIGDAAFGGCTSLTNIILPADIVSIGDESFGGCFSLANIIIPNSVTSIGEGAFDSCTSLGGIIIPNNITNIGAFAFENCRSMTNISVDADNLDYSGLDGVLFDKAQATLIQCPSALTNHVYTIPDGVTTITDDAFFYCPNLAVITIPATLTNIIGPPFDDCISLTNICVNATNPAYCSLNGVLFDKTQDIVLQYPLGRTDVSYTIPNSVTFIQGDAFSDCANLVNIMIPNSVTNIGEYGTFLGCSSLANIIIPNGVTDIPEAAFQGCTSLASILIPDTVNNIE
jgi:hypothetical protein